MRNRGQSDVFITTDNGILNKRPQIAQIRIINPPEFILNLF